MTAARANQREGNVCGEGRLESQSSSAHFQFVLTKKEPVKTQSFWPDLDGMLLISVRPRFPLRNCRPNAKINASPSCHQSHPESHKQRQDKKEKTSLYDMKNDIVYMIPP